MYKYKVQVKKVSGRLNESVLPSKSLVVKSKTKKSDEEVFVEASKYYKEKYGLVIESGDVSQVSQNKMYARFLTNPIAITEEGLKTMIPFLSKSDAVIIEKCIKKGLIDKVIASIPSAAKLKGAKKDKETNTIILTKEIISQALSSFWDDVYDEDVHNAITSQFN